MKLLMVAPLIALLAFLGGIEVAGHASPARVTNVYACVNLRTGRMDLQTGPRAYAFGCKTTETAVSWAVHG